jgi:two-component system, NarL family, sensor kinase
MLKENQDIYLVIIIGSALSLFLAIFVITVIVRFKLRQQKHFQEKALMKTKFKQELLQTQIEIQEQTLKNISEEIHDNVGQILSLAKLNLNTLPFDMEEGIKQKVTATKALVSKAINDLRNLSHSMHGDQLADKGLQHAINTELNILQNSGQFNTQLQVNGEHYPINPQKEMVLFRIVQEALHNAVKHSKANNLWVALCYLPQQCSLAISDDGAGFEITKIEQGIGLKSMQNRSSLIGADFSVHSSPGKGTTITVILKRSDCNIN